MSDKPWLGKMTAEERVDRFLGRQNVVIESVDPLSRLNLNVTPFREHMAEAIRDAEAHARAEMRQQAAKVVVRLASSSDDAIDLSNAIRALKP